MTLENTKKELLRMKMNVLSGAEYNAITTAISCIEKYQNLSEKIPKLQKYQMSVDDTELYVNLDDVMDLIGGLI